MSCVVAVFYFFETDWRLAFKLVASLGASDIVYHVYRYCRTTRSALKYLQVSVEMLKMNGVFDGMFSIIDVIDLCCFESGQRFNFPMME